MSDPIKEKAKAVLKKVWGYDDFRSPQDDIIKSIHQGNDTLVLLPTGGGKSLCYQVPALMSGGKVLVVSPLVSLMLDQVKALNKLKVNAKAIHGGLRANEIDIILDNFVHGPLKILYVSPERIANETFQVRFYMANVDFVAVDEAHCISQWGHDFRPSYLKIAMLRELKPNVSIIALTATATPKILEDISAQLYLTKPNIFTKSFARENISFSVYKTEDKSEEIFRILDKIKGCTIIYMRSRTGCAKIADWLISKGISAIAYHAGMSHTQRDANQQKWMSNNVRVMVATNAFGMGIDKKDVRCVIHLDIPSSVEDYYQEAGRAGRDGEQSYAISLVNNSDVNAASAIFDYSYPSHDEIKKIYIKLCQYWRVAIDSGAGRSFYLDYEEFCSVTKINIYQLQSVLRILEKQGWITASDGMKNPPKVMITADSRNLYYLYKEDDVRHLVLVQLLRTKDGIFDEMVEIDFNQISIHTGLEIGQVLYILKVLVAEGILVFNDSTNLPEVIFNIDRPADHNFRLDENALNDTKNEARKRLDSIVEYFAGSKCRQQVLLEYFGENAEPCGSCDICKGSAILKYSIEEKRTVLKNIFEVNSAVNTKQILHMWPMNKRKRIQACLDDLKIDGFIDVEKNGVIIRKKALL